MDKGTVIRTIILAIAWINAFLASNGLYEIPNVSEEQVSMGIAFVVSVYTWFKNNYVTARGKKQKKILDMENLS
jgi:SPP1 family holin